MGRVYNALVKAQRLNDPERPIGRPDREHAVRSTSGEVNRARAPHSSGHTADTTSFPHRPTDFVAASTEAPRSALSGFCPSAQTGFLPSAATPQAPPTPAHAEKAVAVTVTSMGIAASAAGTAAARELSTPAPHTAPPVIVPEAFPEARRIVDVKNLRIAPHLAGVVKGGGAGGAVAAERYRTLGMRLSTMAARRRIKTIVFTSAETGEGKSTVAASLAWVLACRPGRRVLLLDANLRGGSINRLLDIPPQRGWLDLGLISGREGAGGGSIQSSLASALVRIDPNGLYLMAARGSRSEADALSVAADSGANAAIDDALMSSRFEKLMMELAARFDLILIDAPAALEFGAAQQLAALCDGSVIVTRAGRTDHRRFSEAIEMVPHERRLGVVLNDCEDSHDRRSSLFGRFFRR